MNRVATSGGMNCGGDGAMPGLGSPKARQPDKILSAIHEGRRAVGPGDSSPRSRPRRSPRATDSPAQTNGRLSRPPPPMKHRAKILENPATAAAVLAGVPGPKLCLGEMSVSKMLLFGRWFCWGAFDVGFPFKKAGCLIGFEWWFWKRTVVGLKTDVDSKTFSCLGQIPVDSFTHGWGRETRDHG